MALTETLAAACGVSTEVVFKLGQAYAECHGNDESLQADFVARVAIFTGNSVRNVTIECGLKWEE